GRRASDQAQAQKSPAGGRGWWTKRRFRTSLFLVRCVLPGLVGGSLMTGHRERGHKRRSRSRRFHVADEDLAKPYIVAIDGGGRIGVLLDHGAFQSQAGKCAFGA